MAKADGLIAAVSAASIVAKVARDRYMAALTKEYEPYGFERNAGYGTALHRAAIEAHGVKKEHRLSFAPLRKYAHKNKSEDIKELKKSLVQSSGIRAESLVAAWYEAEGWTIIARNWRTKWCEIDVVVVRDGFVQCIEVKYRKNNIAGGPLAAMTPAAVRKRLKAAEQFAAHHQISDITAYVVPVSGQPMQVGAPVLIGQSPFN
jgi:ribonuclease HII